MFVRTLEDLRSVSQKILHQKDRDGVDSNSHGDHAESTETYSQRSESRKIEYGSG